MSAPLLQTHALTLHAGERVLVDWLDLRVAPGECWCLAGPNGAGKTTLLGTLAGLRALDGQRAAGASGAAGAEGIAGSGRVEIGGKPLAQWRPAPLARVRALMPQQSRDAFGATALEVVLAGRHPYLTRGRWGAWESDGDVAAALAALAHVGLEDFAQRDVTTLSGGERQRVSLAAVLAQATPLLLLDEPVSHLDLHHQIDALALLANYASHSGHGGQPDAAVVFSCHDLNLARRFATHALLLDGRGGWRAGPAHDVLSAEHCSEALGYPLRLIRDGDDEALVPVRRG
ncbi:ABC transporter ATP-binding protein [Pandoraea nosoerga]|uniref:ABC transporter ATP-binding protein n=1 Tax=Pandoraea nosoerga TaxID=2508296 RepID=A0A5E4W421_9BURK|nr:ABC transporter ATP-binding protein [Pandoraea nosoerga]MBN4667756.1 ABC transporter ATP-binding protein [Pandoraea nosoerga]MBN4677643.1 ABC transporter ATP-binding protein [Pandoraea nosoerga]MBN4682565.1 ABC transporter ATP-binding protein [Pandoraea nosoerga]MBN4744980.1 ABC transporter ATP-binding protein [Pandoraea nosoerga]VVE19677.1 ABC transporter ATP-binding protein [Pandoraea nosoerga]